MISPIPPTWGGVGDMWGLGHTICAPWWGKGQLTVWGSKFNFFNMCSTIHLKKNLPGVGVGEWWGKGHCCNAPWGGERSLVNGQFPHPAPGGGGGGGGGGGLIIDRCITQPPNSTLRLSLSLYLSLSLLSLSCRSHATTSLPLGRLPLYPHLCMRQLTRLGELPLYCFRILLGSLIRTSPARTSHVNSPTMGSRHSLNCGLLPPNT